MTTQKEETMTEHDDIINRIEHALDHGSEFIPQNIIELLEDAEMEIADLRRWNRMLIQKIAGKQYRTVADMREAAR